MSSVLFFKFRFTPSWKMLLLTLLFFLLFVRLGFWQLQRADEKKNMVTAQEKLRKIDPRPWSPKQNLPIQYERIQLEGTYLPDVFLLDNQHYQHQFGYHVLSPMALANGTVVLIDRGWIRGHSNRRIVPEIQVPEGLRKLQGTAYFPSRNQWMLGDIVEKKEKNIFVLEQFDDHLLSKLLQKEVYPFIIRLNEQATYGFVRHWETVSMSPQRHIAYALQWFVMAFVILVIFLASNLKKRNEKTVQ